MSSKPGFQILGKTYSDKLKALYGDVRLLAGKEIDFVPSNNSRSEARSHGERIVISLAQSVPEATVAHELMHSLMYAEGFPQMFFCSPSVEVAHGLMNASFDHLIINQRLQARSFDYKKGTALISAHKGLLAQKIQPSGEQRALAIVLLLHQLIKFGIYAERPQAEAELLRTYPFLRRYWDTMRTEIKNTQAKATPEAMWGFYSFHQRLCAQIAFESNATLDVLKYLGISPFFCSELDSKKLGKDLFRTGHSEHGQSVFVIHKETGFILASLQNDEAFVGQLLNQTTVEDACKALQIKIRVIR